MTMAMTLQKNGEALAFWDGICKQMKNEKKKNVCNATLLVCEELYYEMYSIVEKYFSLSPFFVGCWGHEYTI